MRSTGLNVHFHTLALDGVYVRDESGALQFHRLPDPTHEEVVERDGAAVDLLLIDEVG